jgi:hypothetical protein
MKDGKHYLAMAKLGSSTHHQDHMDEGFADLITYA